MVAAARRVVAGLVLLRLGQESAALHAACLPPPGRGSRCLPLLMSLHSSCPFHCCSSVPTGLPAATTIGRSVTIGQGCLLRSCTVRSGHAACTCRLLLDLR